MSKAALLRVTRSFVVLALSTAVVGACKKTDDTVDPDAGTNLLGPGTSKSGGDDDLDSGGNDPFNDKVLADETMEVEPRKDLPPRAKPTTKCQYVREGGKKKKECGPVDPKPGISAAHGVYTLMGEFRWGMSPAKVFKLLSRDIEEEYAERQKGAEDPMEQDEARHWRTDQLQLLKANYTRFAKAASHRWGVSLIQHEYEDDNGEEMLWVRMGNGLRKFYFFKDQELWKIFYAYSTDVWPGMTYEQVMEDKFERWFGPSPAHKVLQDPETAQPLLRYEEWDSLDGDVVRAFDMTQVHGVMALVVLDGAAEKRIGQRLPKVAKDERYEGVVEGVLGGTDVCYDDSGAIVGCTEAEAMGFGNDE